MRRTEAPMESNILQRPGSVRTAECRVRTRPISGRMTAYYHSPSNGFIEGSYLSQPESEQKNIPLNRRRRGVNGLTKAGKELIEDGIIHLWQLSKERRVSLVFWTVTLPTHYQDGSLLTEDDHKRLLEQWPEIVKRIFEELARLYARAGLPNRWIYVVEPQEERFKQHGVFAPHIHAVMVNRWELGKRNPQKDNGFQNSGYWSITTEQTDGIVERVLSNALGKPVDCRSACQVDGVKGMEGLFFYLTKLGKLGRYISKGSKQLQKMAQAGWEDYFPPNWYGCDRMTRKTVRDSVQTYDLGETSLWAIAEGLRRESEEFKSEHGRPLFRDVYLIQPDECETPVALVTSVCRLSDIETGIEAMLEFDRNIAPKSGYVLMESLEPVNSV